MPALCRAGLFKDTNKTKESHLRKIKLTWMYLYIVQNNTNGLTKIGVSDNLERRIKQLENACGSKLHMVAWVDIPHAVVTEKFLHATFDLYRRCGEWFELGEREMKYLIDIWYGIFQPLCDCIEEGKSVFFSFQSDVVLVGDTRMVLWTNVSRQQNNQNLERGR